MVIVAGDYGLVRPPQLQTQHQSRRRRVWPVVLLGLVVLVVAGAVWLALFSGYLAVKKVDVDGVALVTTDDVRDAAAIPPGSPLVTLRQSDVEQRVTQAIPEVKSITLSRRWSGDVVIHVTERVAVFKVADGGLFDWVADDGTVFHVSPDAPPVLLADVATDDSNLLADVATVVLALPPDLTKQVKSLSAASRDAITLQLDSNRQVVWGSADQSILKAEVLQVLLKQPGHVYDVSAPTSPAVR